MTDRPTITRALIPSPRSLRGECQGEGQQQETILANGATEQAKAGARLAPHPIEGDSERENTTFFVLQTTSVRVAPLTPTLSPPKTMGRGRSAHSP